MATALTTTLPSSSYVRDNWSDLPDELLHLILLRLRHFQDLLAFSSACRSWRSLARSTISASPTPLFPPLLIRPLFLNRPRRRRRRSVFALELIDPTRPPVTPYDQRGSPIGKSILEFPFLSSSHGHLLFLSGNKCQVLIVNLVTGCQIASPTLPRIKHDLECRSIAQLTAPVSSPSCTLVLLTVNHLFLWKVNSPRWVSHYLPGYFHWLMQMVVVDTRIWVLELEYRISLFELPQDTCSEVPIMTWKWDTFPGSPGSKDMHMRLVNCEGEILSVCFVTYDDESKVRVEVVRFELMANNQLRYVKINIGNQAFFLSDAVHVPVSICNNPERWGGKRNCVYYAHSDGKKDWSVLEVGQFARWSLFKKKTRLTCCHPFWDFSSTLQ